MNLINEDTHTCDLNLYETIFQNWCLIDELNSMTPDTEFGVTPPNANTSSEAFLPPNDSSKTYNFTGSNLESTLDQGLPTKDLFGHPPKNLFFTGSTSGPELSAPLKESELESNDLHNYRPIPKPRLS